MEFAVKETTKKQPGRSSRTSIDSDILPTFDPVNTPLDWDADIRSPKLFAPTPTPATPGLEVVGECREERTTGRAESEVERRPESRNQQIRLEPVRMPMPRLQTSTSTTSLQRLKDTTSTTTQLQVGKPGPLGLKKAYSNVDIGQSGKAASRKPSQSKVKVGSKFQKNVSQPFSSPVRQTTSSSSLKSSTPSPLSSPRRGSISDHTSPDRKGSSVSQSATSPASPTDGSEVGSDRDLRSPVLSSSSEGEVRTLTGAQ